MRLSLFFAAACMLAVICGCQTVADLPQEKKEFVAVREIPGIAKDQLYLRARGWFVKTFVSAKAVLEVQDKEAGEIGGNAIISQGVKDPGGFIRDLGLSIHIALKDGKYRVTFSRFECVGARLDWDWQLTEAIATSQKTEAQLFEAMQKPPADF